MLVEGKPTTRSRPCLSDEATLPGENGIVVISGANASTEWSPADEAMISTGAAVVAQLERPASLVRRAFEFARAHDVVTVLTPAPGNAEARDPPA